MAKLSFLVGALLCAGGVVVLVRGLGVITVAEIRLFVAINFLIWGAYLFQLSNAQYLRSRIEALEKRLAKAEIRGTDGT